MNKFTFKIMAIVLCFLCSGFTFPARALAQSVPTAPTNLTQSVTSGSMIYLTWDYVSTATYYSVYRATSPSGSYTLIASPTSNSYTDPSVVANTSYYYKVQAANSAGTSADSTIIYAAVINSSVAPSGLTATPTLDNYIYLSWNAATSASYYIVYRSTSSSGTYSTITTTSTTYFTDSSVSQGNTYYYKVQAVRSTGSGEYSEIVSSKADYNSTSNQTSAPTNLSAVSTGSTAIYLSWDATPYTVYYYEVYRATSYSGTYSRVAAASTTYYTDTVPYSNETYYYKVRAVSSAGESSYSAIVNTIAGSTALTAPTNLSAVSTGSTSIYLNWGAVNSASYYVIYRSTSSGGTYSAIGTVTTTYYTDNAVSVNTAYYYKLQAVNSSGSSEYSDVVYASIGNMNSTLTSPTNLRATAVSSVQIYLTWDQLSSATYYNVYRSTAQAGSFDMVTTVTTASYTDSGLTPDTSYYYMVQGGNSSGSVGTFSDTVQGITTVSNNTSSKDIKYTRLAGLDLYETAAEVAKAGWKTSYYAIIVSGENYPDALCSAPLAHKYNAPILLTSKNALNEQSREELSRLKVKNVLIIGGTGVISAAVEQSVKDMGIEVARIAGIDCYETSLKVAQTLGQSKQAIVASGESFPDVLSATSIAAMKEIPILLTPQNKLPESLRSYLATNIQSTYVVGGTSVVSAEVFAQLPSPKRLSGSDRYETNIEIIKEFAVELDFSTCYIATGEQFADALAGSALASLTNSPLILVSNPVGQSTLNYIKSKLNLIKEETIFGGSAVVPQSVIGSLK